MSKYPVQRAVFVLLAIIAAGMWLPLVSAAPSQLALADESPDSLKQKIEEKNAVLQNIQAQREILEDNLEQISKSQNSLKKELRAMDSNISQLNLSVRENAVIIEKLGLEIKSLEQGILDARASIVNKREAIKQLLVEMQLQQQQGILAVVLKSATLSENLEEINRIMSVNQGLQNGIVELENLEEGIKDKIEGIKLKREQEQIERTNLENRKGIVSEQKGEKERILTITKSTEEVYQEQLSALEKMQMDIASEIEAIESELRKKIDPNLIPIAREGVFALPAIGNLTQGYGNTRFARTGYKSGRHNGVDIGASIGSEIFAAEDGQVIAVGDQDKYCRKGAYGKFVMIKHPNGLTTLYGHFSKYIVAIGQHVERGQIIGYVGKTGYATGPHLHFTVFANSTLAPARPGYPEGTQPSRSCGPMPIGGDLDPTLYINF